MPIDNNDIGDKEFYHTSNEKFGKGCLARKSTSHPLELLPSVRRDYMWQCSKVYMWLCVCANMHVLHLHVNTCLPFMPADIPMRWLTGWAMSKSIPHIFLTFLTYFTSADGSHIDNFKPCPHSLTWLS